MRVLMFEPTGGYWPYTHELAEALGSFTQVDLLTSQKHSGVYSYGMHAILRPMAAHLRAPGTPLFGGVAWALDRLSCSLSWLVARERLAGKLRPDLVHLQSTIPLFDQYLLPAFAKKYPVLYTVHDVLPFTSSRAFGSFAALQAVYNASWHLIVHSEANRRELLAVFGMDEGKISVIPHGLRRGEKLNKNLAKKRLSFAPEEKLILVFGGIRESKGLDLAIGALAEVRREFPQASLVVAGSGGNADLAWYYRLAQEVGVAEKIHWRLEYIPELEVGTYFSAADLVLLPYKKFHAQSGVLLQAYKYSVPVVVTDRGALGETVRQDRVGLVAREATAQKLAECIVRIFRSRDLQAEFSQNMHEGQEKYDWDNVAARTMALYEQLMKSGIHQV